MRRSVSAWSYALLVASFLYALLETLMLASEPDWLGSASTSVPEFLTAVATYGGILATISVFPAALSLAFGRRRNVALPAAVVYAAGFVLGGVLLAGDSVVAIPLLVLAAALLSIGFVTSLVGNRFDDRWRRTFTLIVVLSLAAAALTAHEIRYALLESKDMTSFPVAAAMVVALVTLAYGCYRWVRAYERRRRWSTWVRVVSVALAIPLLARCYADYRGLFQGRNGPRMLIATADTMRADYMSLYGGHVPTPHLERFGEEGAVFEQSYALSSWTVPSLCGLMSSRYPPSTTSDATDQQWNTDITLGFPKIAPYWTEEDGRTIFGDLTHLGVPTALFMANIAMLSHPWLVDDFEFSRSTFSLDEQRRGAFKNMPLLHAAVRGVVPDAAPYGPYDTSALTRDCVRAYIRQHRFGPFIVWAHFLDPHAPYAPPKRFAPDGVALNVFPPDGISLKKSFGAASPDRESAKALYEGEIQYVDECIGEVLECIDDLRLTGSLLVCFTSDHGEEFWDHEEWGHGHSLYEELIHVPLILRGPNVAARRIPTPVSAIHVLPTLAGWMGAGVRPRWRGRDLSPLLKDAGAPLPDEPLFMGATYRFGVNTEPFECVAWKRYKLIRGLRTGSVRLYNIHVDPDERIDVSIDHPDVVTEYVGLLDRWNESFPSRITDIWQRSDTAGDSDEILEAFEALGYL